jgi:hypothetical protein
MTEQFDHSLSAEMQGGIPLPPQVTRKNFCDDEEWDMLCERLIRICVQYDLK